ncbi:MAG: alkaline phosphatase family protein [Clostridia bacterium]|nr:alkaline phosphatase family protein [Clostridia bacterium]
MKKSIVVLKPMLLMLFCVCLMLTSVACGGESEESVLSEADESVAEGTSSEGSSKNESSIAESSIAESSSEEESSIAESSNEEDLSNGSEEPKEESEAEESREESKDEEDMNYTYKHVIVIGVDGAGSFFNKSETPNIDKIFADGAISYKVLTENPSISAQCWGSLMHGVTNNIHGLTNAIVAETAYPQDSKYPSFFKVVSENDSKAVMGSFTNWNPINVGIVENGINVYKYGSVGDSAICNAVCNYVSTKAPKLVFVQFDEVDGAGHSSGYNTPAHFAKITEIDGYIGKIYEAYEKKGILDDTLFIVTADHGGNGTSHGGYTDGEKYIMFAAAGKTVEKGTIGDMEIRDTASVVLHAFGYEQPETWTSRVPSGLFKGVTAGERPVYVDKTSNRYHETVPTPEKGSGGHISNFVDTPLKYYLPFDGDIKDVCGNETAQNGKLYYIDGYFGKGVSLDDGYVSIKNYAPQNDSFTVGMWVNTGGVTSDPVLFSNKNWVNGYNNGYVLSLRNTNDVKFNFGNGTVRADVTVPLPSDYRTGWMYVLTVVDREKAEVRISVDFGEFSVLKLPEALKNTSANAFNVLNIGQDGSGNYNARLAATVDEFMLFDGVLDKSDVSKLKEYYGK